MGSNREHLIAPGETLESALGVLARSLRRAHIRCKVARRRFERTRLPGDEFRYLQSAEEYYYAAVIFKDFKESFQEEEEKNCVLN